MEIESKFKNYKVILEKDIGFFNELTMMENAEFVIDENVFTGISSIIFHWKDSFW